MTLENLNSPAIRAAVSIFSIENSEDRCSGIFEPRTKTAERRFGEVYNGHLQRLDERTGSCSHLFYRRDIDFFSSSLPVSLAAQNTCNKNELVG